MFHVCYVYYTAFTADLYNYYVDLTILLYTYTLFRTQMRRYKYIKH